MRVSSWGPTPLLEPSTRHWCQTPRRWSCPTWLLERPSLVRDLECERFCLHGDKTERAVSTARGLARTYLAGSSQRQNPVFRRDDTYIDAAVDNQTRTVGSHTIQRENRHTCDTEKIRGQKYRKEILPLGERSSPWSHCQPASAPKVTVLWLGRHTLSDEHLVGTAAGVTGSRAIRRLQEPTRWVPAALNAMLFTPWSPHLNLPSRSRLQRPA